MATGYDFTGVSKKLINEWNKRHSDSIFVEVDTIPGGTFDEWRTMLDGAGNGDVDIVNLDTIHIADFVARGLISPIRLRNKGEFLSKTLESVQVHGEPDYFWAVPFNADVGMLFTRNPNYSEDPPGLADIVRLRSEASFVGQLSLSGEASREPFVVNILEHALAQHQEILEGPSSMPVYDLEMWRTALDPLKQAIARGSVIPTGTEQQSLEEFKVQGLQYMRNWPVKYRELRDDEFDVTGIRVSSLPTGILGGASLALTAKSRHQAAVLEVIDYLTSVDSQKLIAEYGLVPTRTTTFADEELKKEIPHLEELRNAVENARVRPLHRNYLEFSRAVRTHIGPFLKKSGSKPLGDGLINEMQSALSV